MFIPDNMIKKHPPKNILETIPGVGKSIANDLNDIGIYQVSDLVGKNPEDMYKKLCLLRRIKIDTCVLYVFRCAVYYSTNAEHDQELLKWWNWKNRII